MTKVGWAKISLALLIVVLFFLATFIRPVRIATERGNSTLLLWAWQKGRIEFINSITGHPVVMRFSVPWRFSGFFARTDAGTEEYYTMGLYRWNDQLAKESTRNINYCSEVGVAITFGKQIIRTQGGCIRAALLWPPS
ncbi:MAG: hypothetical protein K0B01_00555 [Syntrophobacterales bacterium]|nr:hypothetical protein [Syntrophobacterales bacterium]